LNRMAVSVNVTVAMPPEMLTSIEEAAPEGMSRAEYIRRCIRDDYEETLRVADVDGLELNRVKA